MSEYEFLISKFYFLDDRIIPMLSSIDVAVPFYSEKKNKKVEFTMLSSFLEIVFGSHLYYNIIMEENASHLRSQKLKASFSKKKAEKGCFFRFSFENGFLDKYSFLYSVFFFRVLAREKRDLMFYNSFFQVIFRDLEMGSFFLGDHKVNLSFQFNFDCKAWTQKGHKHIGYFLPYLSSLYSLGFDSHIYRDEFDFLKKEKKR